MNRTPSWVRPWGVIAILIGAFGILSGAWSILTPRVLKMQRGMMDEMFRLQAEQDRERSPDDARAGERAEAEAAAREMARKMMRALELTTTQERWLSVSGVLGAALSGLYVLAAAFVLQLRPLGVKLFSAAAGAKIALALAGLLLVAAPDGIGAWMFIPAAVTSVVVHGVMLAILLFNARDLAPRGEAGFEAPR